MASGQRTLQSVSISTLLSLSFTSADSMSLVSSSSSSVKASFVSTLGLVASVSVYSAFRVKCKEDKSSSSSSTACRSL
ncbi:hypothetical protein PF010_g29994 [Phytophthora fragariae]|uniref:Uncharacterized protein n=1 Tax=Phytophthora fragariae TaxID=53985 RepID=A0A6A4BGC3_9STRA|nr:hypothetical protein PF009_g30614 [Phytophthora fragariae]KAE9060992.1 hypothetical protein PF010_g29994 [Phytophthora fragariae]KAE9061973.1 hypothetical protein PF007_g30071 [Phytophthora fragariae]KAE9067117.1 hypothetical protein PF006_g30062 [Phytophthora fragariae]KAE9272132.1 hypothetical protein PF001_g28073 [Phytophthora fragariae]